MNQIKRLLKDDLAIIGEYNGKKEQLSIFTDNGIKPMLDYDKVLDKLNEIIEVVNQLKNKN